MLRQEEVSITTAEIISSVSLALGSVGAVLGVVNTWNLLDRQRVKLVVRPALSFLVPSAEPILTVEVLNLSVFPITVSEIGFRLKNGQKGIAPGNMLNGRPLPQRLEPRESVTAFFSLKEFDPRQIRIAFASTTCGESAEGTSPALEQMIDGTSPALSR